MTTLAELIPASRVFPYRTAIVDTLKAALPEIEVKALPGRLDIADFDDKSMFAPPAIGVAVARLRPPEQRMSGTRDLTAEVILYVVVEDRVVAEQLTFRDEIGLALCDGLLDLLQGDAGRWGLQEIDFPRDAEARPVFTVTTENRGTAYFAVMFHQTLYALGQPFMDMDSQVPGDAAASVLLPGDPGWTPPPAGELP